MQIKDTTLLTVLNYFLINYVSINNIVSIHNMFLVFMRLLSIYFCCGFRPLYLCMVARFTLLIAKMVGDFRLKSFV